MSDPDTIAGARAARHAYRQRSIDYLATQGVTVQPGSGLNTEQVAALARIAEQLGQPGTFIVDLACGGLAVHGDGCEHAGGADARLTHKPSR